VKFRFNERKAAQAAAYLLRKRGTLTYGQLVKLLYLADRRKLLERGTLITGDRLVSMDHGTALSVILALLREGPSSSQTEGSWHRHVSQHRNQRVSAVGDEDTAELSKRELRILDDIDREFGHLTFTQLRNYTHRLGEWKDPHGSSRTIPPERILEVEGRSAEEIALVEENAKALLAIDDLAP